MRQRPLGHLVAVWGNPHRQRPDFSNGNRVSPSMLEPVAAPLSMTLDQLLTLAVSFFTASIVLALWRASTATGSTSR